MNAINKFIQSALLLSFFAAAVYLMGCASAEVNTGKIAFREGNYEKAVVELKKGITPTSTDAEGWYMLGYSLIETGKYQEGAEALRKSLSLSSSFGPDIQNLYIKKFNDGIGKFNAGVKQYNTDSIGAMKTFTDASNLFLATSTIFPDSVGSQQMLADSYTILGRSDEALAIYTKILDKTKSPQDAKQIAKILTDAGTRQYTAGNYTEAISIFSKVGALNYLPQDDQNLHLAKLYKGFSDYKLAESISATSGVNEEAKMHLNNAVTEIQGLVNITTDKNILTDAYQLLVSSYDALGMDAERDAAQQKLNGLN